MIHPSKSRFGMSIIFPTFSRFKVCTKANWVHLGPLQSCIWHLSAQAWRNIHSMPRALSSLSTQHYHPAAATAGKDLRERIESDTPSWYILYIQTINLSSLQILFILFWNCESPRGLTINPSIDNSNKTTQKTFCFASYSFWAFHVTTVSRMFNTQTQRSSEESPWKKLKEHLSCYPRDLFVIVLGLDISSSDFIINPDLLTVKIVNPTGRAPARDCKWCLHNRSKNRCFVGSCCLASIRAPKHCRNCSHLCTFKRNDTTPLCHVVWRNTSPLRTAQVLCTIMKIAANKQYAETTAGRPRAMPAHQRAGFHRLSLTHPWFLEVIWTSG